MEPDIVLYDLTLTFSYLEEGASCIGLIIMKKEPHYLTI